MDDATVENNTFEGNYSSAVLVSGSKNTAIIGNTVKLKKTAFYITKASAYIKNSKGETAPDYISECSIEGNTITVEPGGIDEGNDKFCGIAIHNESQVDSITGNSVVVNSTSENAHAIDITSGSTVGLISSNEKISFP